jgi:hypothetical protein
MHVYLKNIKIFSRTHFYFRTKQWRPAFSKNRSIWTSSRERPKARRISGEKSRIAENERVLAMEAAVVVSGPDPKQAKAPPFSACRDGVTTIACSGARCRSPQWLLTFSSI